MIWTSRQRKHSDDSSIAAAVVIAVSNSRTTGRNSQVHVGETPKARMKMKTAIRLRPRLKRAVSTTENGMTSRGNWVLRTMLSWLTTEMTDSEEASWKNV